MVHRFLEKVDKMAFVIFVEKICVSVRGPLVATAARECCPVHSAAPAFQAAQSFGRGPTITQNELISRGAITICIGGDVISSW